jgi:DUF4097 and DUF4098 domain-containing protein YvlB
MAVMFVAVGMLAASPAREGTSRSQTFPAARGDTIEMRVDSGDIYINTWERDEIQIKAESISAGDHLTMEKAEKTVSVDYEGDGYSGNARFYAQVPATVNLDLRTSGGDIAIKGAISGEVTGHTSGGDILMMDVIGKTDVETSGGDVRTGKIQGEAELKTSGGDITVDSVTGRARLHTSGGDIRVGDVGKTLDASTAGGDITIGNVGGEATVSTAGGDVQVGKVSGSALLKTAGGEITLKGADGKVVAKTAGGDLSLENVTGSIQGETAGGDIAAELNPSGNGPSSLVTQGGDVRLSLPSNAKASIKARIRIRGNWGERSEEYSIQSDFPSKTYEKDHDGREIRATYEINGGGETIELQTVNGDITIRKS